MNQKTRLINDGIIILSIIVAVICLTINISNGLWYEALIDVAVIPVLFLPRIARKMHLEIIGIVENLYLLFIFFAYVLGSIIGFYDIIYGYDKIMHFLSGFLTALGALIILVRFNKYDSKAIIFNSIFILSFVLAIAGIWEIFEFSCDHLFRQDAQNVITTGVNDTMMDIIMANLASILVVITYIYEQINQHHGLIYKISTVINKR